MSCGQRILKPRRRPRPRTKVRLGRTGNKSVYIPLICKTHFGNSDTMVRWVKQTDGSYKGDFTIMEKHLDIAEKYQGKPPVVCFIMDLKTRCMGSRLATVRRSGRINTRPIRRPDTLTVGRIGRPGCMPQPQKWPGHWGISEGSNQ